MLFIVIRIQSEIYSASRAVFLTIHLYQCKSNGYTVLSVFMTSSFES